MDKEQVLSSLEEMCDALKSAEAKRTSGTLDESTSTVGVVPFAEKSTEAVNKKINETNSQNNLTIEEVIELENFSTTVAEKLYEIPTSVLSLCEQALCKRQRILDWLQTLLFNSGATISSDEFAGKLHELIGESDELAVSYNVAMTRLRRGVTNTMDLLQKVYLERDLLRERNETLSVEIAELHTMNDMLELRFVASSGDHPAKDSKVKELELELTNEKNRKAILRERLQKADARLKVKNEELKDALVKLENSDMHRTALVEKMMEMDRGHSAMENEYQEQMDKSKASLEANLEKLDTINEHVYELEQIISTQRQQLDKQSIIINMVPTLEEDNKDLRKSCEKYGCQVDTLERRSRNLETTNQHLLQNLKEQSEAKEELVKELEVTKVILKSVQTEKDNEEKKETSEKTFNESDVQTDLDAEALRKMRPCESAPPAMENQLQHYEQQVQILRNTIAKLGSNPDDVRKSDSIPELKDVVISQRTKIIELTQEIGEVTTAMVERDALITKYEQSIEEQSSLLRMKDEVIEMLTSKDADLISAVQFLHQKIEAKERTENEIKKELMAKSEDKQKLVTNLELKKARIVHLERLVVNLQKQHHQRKKIDDCITDQDQVNMSRLDEARPTRAKQHSRLNVENLLKLLEFELDKSENAEFQRLEEEARCLMNDLPVLERNQSTSVMKQEFLGLTRSKYPSNAGSMHKSLLKSRLDDEKSESGGMIKFRSKFLNTVSNDDNFVFTANNVESIFRDSSSR